MSGLQGYDAWKTASPDDEYQGDDDQPVELDAYGHMTWTMGDADWTACFDAVRVGNAIAYHVVVNCESGGFIDTVEKGLVPITEAAKLAILPSNYADVGLEGHSVTQSDNSKLPRSQRITLGRFAYRDCEKRWVRHIKQLVKQKTDRRPA